VEVGAVAALGAEPAGEEEAEIRPGDVVGERVARVPGDVAAALGGRLAGGTAFTVAAAPLVVPDAATVSVCPRDESKGWRGWGQGGRIKAYLKVTPVCGGGSVRNVAGSTCGRAGLRFLRMILRPFCVATAVVAPAVVVATAVSVLSVEMPPSGDRDRVAIGAAAASLDTSAMVVILCDVIQSRV
jgi:hypothetical protein